MHSPDDDIRKAFEELRRADAASTPTFRHLWNARRSPKRPRFQFIAAAACLLMLIGLLLVLKPRPREMPPIPATLVGPTDFLLDTPGRDFARSVPQFASPVPNYAERTSR